MQKIILANLKSSKEQRTAERTKRQSDVIN